MKSECEKGQRVFWETRNPRGCAERMNLKRWMRDWQSRFDNLGVEVVVADVAQSSVAVDMADRTIILSPHLAVHTAERVLERLYRWWRRQPVQLNGEMCSLVSH
jgi:hypothetical protein